VCALIQNLLLIGCEGSRIQHSMKFVLSIAVGVFIAGMLLWWMSDPDGFRHKLFGYSQSEIDQSWEKVRQQEAEVKHELDDRLLEAKTRTVELRYGEAAASKYNLCHKYPPTTKQHQLECQKLDDRLARDDARDEKKNPW
jgi:hypothetical protein